MHVGLIVNTRKPRAAAFVVGLVRWLESNGHEPLACTAPARLSLGRIACSQRQLVRQAELVVALGGDGTLLRAARLVGRRETPVMGVNMGGLGFLTAFSTREARAGITAFTRGRHQEEARVVLACRYGSRLGFALNDCCINMGPSGRVIKVIVHSGGKFVNSFVGDGIVVATPTGSTAYSLAAGGPVVFPTMQAILLTPVAPHALAARPLILPAEAEIELETGTDSGPAVLNLDGQQRWPVRPGRPVRISRADFCVRLVVPGHKSYYRILREKMKWSGSRI
jgi:NAD+ kinase